MPHHCSINRDWGRNNYLRRYKWEGETVLEHWNNFLPACHCTFSYKNKVIIGDSTVHGNCPLDEARSFCLPEIDGYICHINTCGKYLEASREAGWVLRRTIRRFYFQFDLHQATWRHFEATATNVAIK